MNLFSILLSLFFFAYYERVETYARLFLTQKPGATQQEPRIFIEEHEYDEAPFIVGYLYYSEDLQYPIISIKGWADGRYVPMRRYDRDIA
ncbi:hypothetical protein A7K93_01050 [Candidatus Methylacidiphilum fumarolicum]|uniref:Uncharacterized protein n=2 Tax=Candidatus Methylacidiphilum fumarolicum TaxID=591154 RepID=I0JXU7_METFB|nr:hypothetical protein [Candidatus Methylacidiphilum fumarolicum]MBW6414224.1 hypothetical protein [Candidatus Methylacidiphilum fumarolicum]TFE69942.1 hypothetical protein A7K73_04865 [Candidatus Methylacidiphilum fumarolicum]TFE73746.1 hypothetical protein A7K72_05460 [Candidatus Methylacidiphilum fumarolicum]TFE75648.1 hypothetical protein A7K93_01050 [Candidatus Methylacidiphilum fumarolicum]TFE76811.1 hypothetical protein A7D33_08480 [Candidatus Methylacidiphilum fumarolicum]